MPVRGCHTGGRHARAQTLNQLRARDARSRRAAGARPGLSQSEPTGVPSGRVTDRNGKKSDNNGIIFDVSPVSSVNLNA